MLQSESSALKKYKCKRLLQNGQKRLRVALKVLEEVTIKFPNTKQFIDDAIEEQCQKEKITTDEVIFYKSRSKEKHYLLSSVTLF